MQTTISPGNTACEEILKLWAELNESKKQIAESFVALRDTRGRNQHRPFPIHPISVAYPVVLFIKLMANLDYSSSKGFPEVALAARQNHPKLLYILTNTIIIRGPLLVVVVFRVWAC